MVFPKSNLPSGSVPWGREVQKRIEETDSKLASLAINDRSDTKQLQDSYRRLDKTVQGLKEADVKIVDALALATQAALDANNAITAIGSLDEATSTYKINADNLTAGTITGLNIVGNTIKSAAAGTRIEIVGTTLTAYYGTIVAGEIVGASTGSNNGIRISEPTGHSVWVTSDSVWLTTGGGAIGAYLYVSKNNGILMGTTYSVSINAGVRITKSENISNNSSSSQGPLVINDGSYYMKFDGNEISSYTSGGSGANLFLNGTGSNGAIILGDGGGATSVRNALNAQGGLTVSGGGITSSGIYSNLVSGRDMYITSAGVMGYATSSRKYKRDIEELDLDLNAILSIKPISFKYNIGLLKQENGNDPDEIQWGFIAEDLHDAGLTGIVDYDPETGDVEGIKYARFVVALQAVVRSQQEQIKSLSDRIEILERR